MCFFFSLFTALSAARARAPLGRARVTRVVCAACTDHCGLCCCLSVCLGRTSVPHLSQHPSLCSGRLSLASTIVPQRICFMRTPFRCCKIRRFRSRAEPQSSTARQQRLCASQFLVAACDLICPFVPCTPFLASLSRSLHLTRVLSIGHRCARPWSTREHIALDHPATASRSDPPRVPVLWWVAAAAILRLVVEEVERLRVAPRVAMARASFVVPAAQLVVAAIVARP